MKKLTCAIIDDEPLAVKLIESYARRIDFIEVSGCFTDSLEAIEALRQDPVDFVFLDIQMPDMDGMEFARSLPENTKVVFTTAFKDYALESYDVSAVDFLLKPIRYDKILRACEKVKERFKPFENPDKDSAEELDKREIFLRVDGEFKKIDIDKILYVEGMKDYVRFFLENDNPLITHMTMKSVEELLPETRFMRVNRSYIVALNKIRTIDRNFCIYIGGTMIKVTDQYRDNFEEYLKKHVIS